MTSHSDSLKSNTRPLGFSRFLHLQLKLSFQGIFVRQHVDVVTREPFAAPAVVEFLPQLPLETFRDVDIVDVQPILYIATHHSNAEVSEARHGADLDKAELHRGAEPVRHVKHHSPHLTPGSGKVRLVMNTDHWRHRGGHHYLLEDPLTQRPLHPLHVVLGVLRLPQHHLHEAPPVAQLV